MSSNPLSFVICSILVLGAGSVQRCVEILDAGQLPIVKDHIGIHFYVTVVNKSPDPMEVEVREVQCCEDFPGANSDCSAFHLIPETRIMAGNSTRNFTLIHPTLYPHDRHGECLLGVHYFTSCNRSKEARQHITFDTNLSQENLRCNILRGFPTTSIDTPACRSYDEDSLDHCRGVDCHKKYFGLKSFFNRGSLVCEPVPACVPTKRRGMPDVVYDVQTNQCQDLTSCLGDEDLQHLSHADLEPECSAEATGKMPFVNCHDGVLSNMTGECVCPKGMTAAYMPEEPGNPRTQVFHSCSVDSRCWRSWYQMLFTFPDLSTVIISTIIALIVATITIIALWQ